MQNGVVSGLDRLRSEAQGSGEKNQKCDSGCVMQKYTDALRRRCQRDVRKEVEAPLDIKDVIHQISCFSKIIVMKITLPRTSAFSMMYDRWLWRFFPVAII